MVKLTSETVCGNQVNVGSSPAYTPNFIISN
nr:MAG TPA: hypothetical protein [Caudoviricetes sp.]